MKQKIVPIIMAGGKGTRLWPLSREAAPKQFVRFIGERSLFQETLERVLDPVHYEAPMVLTNEDFRFLVAEQAREEGVELSSIVLEPVGRNTAPAIAAAAVLVKETFGDEAIMQVLPSDLKFLADEVYFDCIGKAFGAAKNGKLVTFGIPYLPNSND